MVSQSSMWKRAEAGPMVSKPHRLGDGHRDVLRDDPYLKVDFSLLLSLLQSSIVARLKNGMPEVENDDLDLRRRQPARLPAAGVPVPRNAG